MNRVNATELSRRPGAVIDQAIREGMVAVIRRGRLVAILSRDPVALPENLDWQPLTASELLADLSAILGNTETNSGAYIVTRNGRSALWVLPRGMLKNLGLEL